MMLGDTLEAGRLINSNENIKRKVALAFGFLILTGTYIAGCLTSSLALTSSSVSCNLDKTKKVSVTSPIFGKLVEQSDGAVFNISNLQEINGESRLNAYFDSQEYHESGKLNGKLIIMLPTHNILRLNIPMPTSQQQIDQCRSQELQYREK